MVAGTGYIKPVVPTFGCVQINTVEGEESFFNWYYFTVEIGTIVSFFVVALSVSANTIMIQYCSLYLYYNNS